MRQIAAAIVLGGSIIVAATIVAAPHPSASPSYVAVPDPTPMQVVIVQPECRGTDGPGGVWGTKAACELNR